MTPRRGITIIVVLVVVIVGALVGVGALDSGNAIANAARTSLDHNEARSIADAGVRAVAEEILAQRDALMEGEDLELGAELELWRDGDRRAVAILLPLGPEGERVVSEAAKLHLNTATAQQLGRLPLLDEALASAIVNARPERGYASLTDLLTIDGVTPELLLGERARWGASWSATGDDDASYDPALIDHLTLHSAEPNAQRGLGEVNAEFDGQQRVNLNRPWSEDIEREIRDLFDDDDTVHTVRVLNQRGAFADEATFVRTLVGFNLPTEDVRWILDLFTTSPDPFLIGRVDVNRAPPEVLACLDGLDDEQGTRLAELRETLEDDRLDSCAWLLGDAELEPASFAELEPLVSVRSLQWRVRIMTGYVRDDEDLLAGEERELEFMRVTEGVVDVAAPRPRLAMLTDLTDRPLVASLMREAEPDDAFARTPFAVPEPEDVARASDAPDTEPTGGAGADEPSSANTPGPGVDRRSGRWTSGSAREDP